MKLFFLLSLFLKQFYILESGSLQIADLCMVLSGVCYIVSSIREHRPLIEKQDILLFLFVVLAGMINVGYYIRYQDVWLIKSSLYLMFNAMVVVIFRECRKEESFQRNVLYILRFNMLLQFCLLVLGVGAYKNEHRYVGTFNDPNQMAFFLFISMLLILDITEQMGRKWRYEIPFFLMLLVLVFYSKSVGITLGVAVLSIGVLGWEVWEMRKTRKCYTDKQKIESMIMMSGMLVIALAVGVAIIILVRLGDEYNLFARIIEKMLSVTNGGLWETLAGRGMDRIWLYPKYFLYGAGEGAYDRLEQSLVSIEMHSSFLGLLFCYGMIPVGLVSTWAWGKLRHVSGRRCMIYLALLVESMFLVNYRQPMFWMLFVG